MGHKLSVIRVRWNHAWTENGEMFLVRGLFRPNWASNRMNKAEKISLIGHRYVLIWISLDRALESTLNFQIFTSSFRAVSPPKQRSLRIYFILQSQQQLFIQIANYGAFYKIKWKSPWARYRQPHFDVVRKFAPRETDSAVCCWKLPELTFHDVMMKTSREPSRLCQVRVIEN